MTRYVDTREDKRERLGPLEAHGFRPKALQVGDVQFPEAGGGIVLVEHKKVSQFITDMSTGQLIKQCRRLAESSDFGVLCLEGTIHFSERLLLGTNYTITQIRNQLLSIQEMGLYIERTADAPDTVERTVELAQRYGLAFHESHQRHPSGNPGIAALALIPGVGEARARAILSRFEGQLGAVAMAHEDEFMACEGVGPVLARRIVSYFAEDWRKR